jgi:hypothetical protein
MPLSGGGEARKPLRQRANVANVANILSFQQ